MSDGKVLLDISNGLGTVTLNSARNGNAIDLILARDFARVMRDCEESRDLRAIVIRGSGRMFCAGGDLTAIQSEGDNASAYVRELLEHLHEAILAIARIPVPVVASVHGAAAGAGLALVCACDLALSAISSRFVMAYSRAGLTPDGSSSWYLPRLLGQRRALELALLNRELSAAEALQWGILNDVAPDDQLASRTQELTTGLVSGPAAVLGETKRLLRSALETDLATQLEKESDTICRALNRPEASIGLAAFRAKAAPKFPD